MKFREREILALRTLAAMPFLDWLELAAVSGLAEATAYRVLRRLKAQGLVRFLRHASPLTATTRRWHLNPLGLDRLAAAEGRSVEYLLRTRPVSAHWQRLLLARLDAVAVIYRLASAIASVEEPFRFRWYRAHSLDAAVTLDGGRTVGIIRQGAVADRTAFSDRVNWLVGARQDLPRGLLALFPDETRLLQARRLLARYPGPVYLALERAAARSMTDEAVWRVPSAPGLLSLEEALAGLRPGGSLPVEPSLARALLPEAVSIGEPGKDVPNHLLPVLLNPADKRLLDCLADWPWATVEDLCAFLDLSDSRVWRMAARLEDLGLVARGALGGKRRLALGERGLTLLARRDRASVSTALRRWSVQDDDGETASHWRDVPGARSRPLARAIEHTDGVHQFLGALLRQAKETPGCRAVQVSPPHHSTRYFRHRGNLRSVHPDAFGVVRAGGKTLPFFLEWERRAVHPSTMADRLAPYLRYYSSNLLRDDHGHRPLVLVVFDDFLAEGNFLGVARGEMERSGVDVPLWISHTGLLEKAGPLGPTWRSPDVLEPSYAFR
ncbi:MAG: replication-relaxation family protein [Chloroflexota bacterium]|nr:replication-relaxation family protein [Chloroflexota bacterium]